MPYLIVALIGGALGLYLVQAGHVTGRRLAAGFYALIGGALGIVVLRYVAGGLGPVGAIAAATIGAVLLLYLAERFGGRS